MERHHLQAVTNESIGTGHTRLGDFIKRAKKGAKDEDTMGRNGVRVCVAVLNRVEYNYYSLGLWGTGQAWESLSGLQRVPSECLQERGCTSVTALLSPLEMSVSSSVETVDYYSGTMWTTGGKSTKAVNTVPGTKYSLRCAGWCDCYCLSPMRAARLTFWGRSSFVYADLALPINGFLQRCVSIRLITHCELYLKCLLNAWARGLIGGELVCVSSFHPLALQPSGALSLLGSGWEATPCLPESTSRGH